VLWRLLALAGDDGVVGAPKTLGAIHYRVWKIERVLQLYFNLLSSVRGVMMMMMMMMRMMRMMRMMTV
jgi:hypothetical protein